MERKGEAIGYLAVFLCVYLRVCVSAGLCLRVFVSVCLCHTIHKTTVDNESLGTPEM